MFYRNKRVELTIKETENLMLLKKTGRGNGESKYVITSSAFACHELAPWNCLSSRKHFYEECENENYHGFLQMNTDKKFLFQIRNKSSKFPTCEFLDLG